MRWKKTLQVLDVHCEGEIGKVITSTTLDVPGATMLDKLVHLNTVDDSLRRMVCFEPRGFAQMSVNLLLPPTRPDADAGFIVLQPDRAHPMSGSNAICVTTALLETGMLEMREPETVLRLDTAAGLVTVTAACRDGKVTSASIATSPSFVQDLDLEIDTTDFGRIKVDVAYGGCFYGLIDVEQAGLMIEPPNAHRLMQAGVSILNDLMANVPVQHPERPQINQFSYVMFRDRNGDTIKTCTVLKPGRVDRSPCGTGSSANLAAMHARGQVKTGDVLTSESIIGSRFRVEMLGETTVGNRAAVLPRVTGRAWVYGISQLGIDPSDPFPGGFALSDTWGPGVDEIL
jgi:proline racemase